MIINTSIDIDHIMHEAIIGLWEEEGWKCCSIKLHFNDRPIYTLWFEQTVSGKLRSFRKFVYDQKKGKIKEEK